MQKIKILNTLDIYNVELSTYQTNNGGKRILLILPSTDLQIEQLITKGFVELNENNNIVQADYSDMLYIYRTLKDGETYILTNDENDVYVEPIINNLTVNGINENEMTESEREIYSTINQKMSQISSLKCELESTDYKIIKTVEFSLVGIESKYDVADIHKSRQDIRDRINLLESDIVELKSQLAIK